MHSRVKQSNLLLYTDDSTGKLLPTVEFDASGVCYTESTVDRSSDQEIWSVIPESGDHNGRQTITTRKLNYFDYRETQRRTRLPLMLGKRVRPQREGPRSCRNTERQCAAAADLLLRAVVVIVIAVADFDFYAHPGMNAALEVVIAFCEVGDL